MFPGFLFFVHPDEDALGVDELDDARPPAGDDVARPLGHQVFDARADQRRLGPQERHRLALHVGAHQRPVGVVVLEERDERRGQGHELLGRNVDVIHLVARDQLEIPGLPGADVLAQEPAVVVDRRVRLGDGEFFLFPGRLVLAVRLDDGELADLALLELLDGLEEGVLADDLAHLVVGVAGMDDLDVVDDAPALDFPVGRFDEPVVVDPGKAAQRGDQADVRPFRGLDRADPSVV